MSVSSLVFGGLDRLRVVLFPVALFGLVVLGLHAGSDRLDDLAFALLHAVDRFVDHVLSGIMQAVVPIFGAGDKTVARWTYAAVSLIDLDELRWAARVLALAFELAADALLVWPVLRYRTDREPWRRAVVSPSEVRNVGAVFAPVAVVLASIAGTLVVAQQAQLQLFWLFRFLGRTGASRAAGIGALAIMAVIVWRLALPTVRAGLAFGRAQAPKGPWYRGWYLAGPLFVVGLAVAPVPLWRTLRGLGPW